MSARQADFATALYFFASCKPRRQKVEADNRAPTDHDTSTSYGYHTTPPRNPSRVYGSLISGPASITSTRKKPKRNIPNAGQNDGFQLHNDHASVASSAAGV